MKPGDRKCFIQRLLKKIKTKVEIIFDEQFKMFSDMISAAYTKIFKGKWLQKSH